MGMRGQSSAGRRGSWQDTAEGDCGNLHGITGVSDARERERESCVMYRRLTIYNQLLKMSE